MIYTSIPYDIQERPVRSFIIINIIVVVVIIIYYCYRIIVISCPYYLCVVWLVGITQPKKKVGTVGCTLWLALQYQNKWYPVVVIDYDSSIIYCLIFFVTTTTILTTPPPTPLLSILKSKNILIDMLWLNFILGLNFISFFFSNSL